MVCAAFNVLPRRAECTASLQHMAYYIIVVFLLTSVHVLSYRKTICLQQMLFCVKCQVLKAASTDFWDTAPCSIVEVYRRFRFVYCLHHQMNDGGLFIALVMETVCTSEMSAYFNETTRC
jgi:hypothetical protein